MWILCERHQCSAWLARQEVVQSEGYQQLLVDASLPLKARHFLGIRLSARPSAGACRCRLERAACAWVCDDTGHTEGACRCREQAIEYWKRGKHAGQAFSEILLRNTRWWPTCTGVWLSLN
jgi:hypothetical protein